MCVYIALMDGEDESLSGQRLFKDHRWRIAVISRVLGSESLKKVIKQPLHPHMLFERVSRKILLAHPKTNSSIFSGQTRLFKRDRTLWSDKMKKRAFWQQTQQMCLVQTGMKSTPCLRLNRLLDLICCGPIFLLEVLDILFRYMALWILSNTNR